MLLVGGQVEDSLAREVSATNFLCGHRTLYELSKKNTRQLVFCRKHYVALEENKVLKENSRRV
jgi:hypothetical protein